ncbi:unnamed protein product [Staurois parvus]|uniref:Uncharacterized protein n=1 Tax=Staurois parvus TaxID=386267 RepID=A0ABN9DWN7_9NEOB|nr:unnamed protein product [Staurois parvus]
MIGTSHRGPVQQSVFHCVRRTQRAPALLHAPRERAQAGGGEAVYKRATRPCTATVRPFIYNGRMGGG